MAKFNEPQHTTTASKPDGETMKLPDSLGSLPKADHFATQRHRWNTNEEIAAILISFGRHHEWLSKEVKIRPKSGSMLLYSRKKVRYRRDGYCWKKRKDGKTTREDHMKLKVQGTECIYGCYVHSAILPTFHRRCYWLLQNPDIVLVHYLNVPYPDDNKMTVTPNLSLWGDKKEWSKDELVSQLKPMFFSEDEPDLNNELEISTAETVEAIVAGLMEKQRQVRVGNQQPTPRRLDCGCGDPLCIGHKPRQTTQVSTTTASNNVMVANSSQSIGTKDGNTSVSPSVKRIPGCSPAAAPVILNLSQIQGSTGLLIVNNATGQANNLTSLALTSLLYGNHNIQVIKEEKVEATDSHMDTLHLDLANGNVVPAKEDPLAISLGPITKTEQPTSSTDTSPFPSSFLQAKVPELADKSDPCFYTDTLDLSQEDIQKTLSVNLPSDAKSSTDINPMDFIENDLSSPEGNVFANLDAADNFTLDMFHDFAELESLEAATTPGSRPVLTQPNSRMDYREGTANITDYSPEWAYTEGGTKVLVTGPWYSTSSPYCVLFDGVAVPTTLVQSGVLRCLCPAHEVGLVSLQVACEGFVISNSVSFEYKEANGSEPTSEDILLKLALLERLEAVEAKLIKRRHTKSIRDDVKQGGNFEDRVVAVCQELMPCPWLSTEAVETTNTKHTLLHIAASLGFSRLVCTLLHWRAENPSPVLETEIDALSTDRNGATPLMRALSRGHREAALLLYQWNRTAIAIRNKDGETALAVARANGHTQLAEEIKRLEQTREQPRHKNTFLHTQPIYKVNEQWSSRTPQLTKHASFDYGIRLPTHFRADRSLSLPAVEHSNPDIKDASHMDTSQLLDLADLSDEEPGAKHSALDPSACCSRRDSFSSCDLSICVGEADTRVFTLAEQIIAALPDRIKNESGEDSKQHEPSPQPEPPSSDMDSSSPFHSNDFIFEYGDFSYRYRDVETPGGSASPSSSSCLQSPRSFTVESPSPPPTTADFTEFFQASGVLMEKDFSNLALSDKEQRELYEAAKIIQKAYRTYKGRKRQEEQEKERQAAVIIQNYYRRYKQYAYFKQMTRAAMVIQHGYRSYCESKRWRKSQETAAIAIQNYYRSYKAEQQERGSHSREGTPTSLSLKRTISQRRQHQAARKIQQFMRQSKQNLWEYVQGGRASERACFSCRKREASSATGCCPPKISLTGPFAAPGLQ